MLTVKHSVGYTEGLVGGIRHFYKLYHWERVRVDKFIHSVILANKTTYHPNCLIAKSLFREAVRVRPGNGEGHYEVIFKVNSGTGRRR